MAIDSMQDEKLVIKNLKKRHKTLALAESCTGGLIADRITNVAGASEVFVGGVVAYSNNLKSKILNVDKKILDEYGAVSPECARAMVCGLKKLTQADYCVAVTGIAGPSGGSSEKPVGTVFVATSLGEKTTVQRHYFPLPRKKFKQKVGSLVIQSLLDSSNKSFL